MNSIKASILLLCLVFAATSAPAEPARETTQGERTYEHSDPRRQPAPVQPKTRRPPPGATTGERPQMSRRQFRQFEKNYEILENRYSTLERRSRTLRRTKRGRRQLEGEAGELKSSVRRLVMNNSGGAGKDVDCVYACETEYSKCLRRSFKFLCSLQAAKCLLGCAVSLKSQVRVVAPY